MTSEPTRDVTVQVDGTTTTANPPMSEITYRVHNNGDASVWLVADEWFTWRRDGRTIEVSFRRERLRPGTHVFGYFDPQVIEIPPGGSTVRTLALEWPHRLSDLWNETEYASLPPGSYRIRVVVGYGRSSAPPPARTADEVEERVLAWQEEASSEFVDLDVPEHDMPPAHNGTGTDG